MARSRRYNKRQISYISMLTGLPCHFSELFKLKRTNARLQGVPVSLKMRFLESHRLLFCISYRKYCTIPPSPKTVILTPFSHPSRSKCRNRKCGCPKLIYRNRPPGFKIRIISSTSFLHDSTISSEGDQTLPDEQSKASIVPWNTCQLEFVMFTTLSIATSIEPASIFKSRTSIIW
jgi:hypothetical protein